MTHVQALVHIRRRDSRVNRFGRAPPLDLTEEHLLFRADGSTVPAYAVQCNDKLASEGGIAVVNSVRRSKSLGCSPLFSRR